MVLALAIVGVAIALGAALGLFGGRETFLLQPVYAFGVVAALSVVAGHLMPEAAEHLGVMALGVFVIGLLVPTAIEAGARRLTARLGDSAPVNIGVSALVLHQLGDGAALGSVIGTDEALDVAIAIGAHTIPLVTLMVALAAQELGAVKALIRAALLASATFAGVVATRLVPNADFETAEPYVSALVAGVLLHVILHAPPSSIVRPLRVRLLEMSAIAAGVGIILFGAHSEESGFGSQVSASFIRLSLACAPALLLGLVAAAGVQTLGARLPANWMRGGPRFLQAFRGAVIGVPLPVCTCGVLPTARALLERGAAPGLIVAFVTAAPVLGVDTFLITARLTSVGFAIGRVLAVIGVAVVAASFIMRKPKTAFAIRARVQGPQSLAARATVVTNAPLAPWWQRALHHFDELVFHVVPWTVAGLGVASYLDVVLHARAIDNHWIDVVLVLVIALPSYVSAAAVTPIAAMLLTKGLSPGAALAGLIIGPATDAATIGFMKRSFGLRATVTALAGLIGALLVVAFAVNACVPATFVVVAADGWLARACAAVLVLLGVRSIWQSGIVAWAEALSRTPREEWRVSRAYARV